MLLVLAVLLTGILQTIALLLGASWLISREKHQLHQSFHEAVSEWFVAEEGKPSKFAEVLDAAGSVVGSAAARSIMASLNAGKSHAVRLANGMVDEVEAQQNPLLGLLGGSKRGKGAGLAQLVQLLGPMLARGGGGSGDNGRNGHSASVADRIKRQGG